MDQYSILDHIEQSQGVSLKTELNKFNEILAVSQKGNYREKIERFTAKIWSSAFSDRIMRCYIIADTYFTAQSFAFVYEVTAEEFQNRIGSVYKYAEEIKTEKDALEYFELLIEACIDWRILRNCSRKKNEIRRAVQYIKKHYDDPDLDLSAAAAKANLSASYFSAVFHQSTGVSFQNYLNALRIKEAQKLLNCTALSIADVAHKAGYIDYRHFSTVFRKKTGDTPSRYRLKNQKNPENDE